MALFLPILRLLMLFLNVYESYKTLKPPLPSSRNPTRPSVRAVTQRKRDMKGCLAVWIVWVSLALYERVLENLVSLFIPFYDEFKSLVLLFLIVTRARGAEPIYLHLIRPVIKPYTRTLDAALELMLMVGDFLIAVSTYPVRLAVQWWKTQFAWLFEPTSGDSSDESSNEASASDVSSSFFGSGRRPIPSTRGGDIRSVRKSSNEIANENRRPSISPGTHRKRGFYQDDLPQEPVPEFSVKRPSSSRQSSRSQTLPTADNDKGEIDASQARYQIWYPPTEFYPDNGIGAAEVDRTLRPLVSVEVREQVTILAEQQTDEWRQYPPFPSAYPPTPIATTSRLVPSLSASIYPPIPEEVNSQQDFHRSLLPPRGPLNPSRAGDLSDYHKYPGIPSFLTSDADDTISTEGYRNEDEDDFNATLKTPLQLNGSVRSRLRPRLFVSPQPISAASSNLSVPSRHSALTTMDNSPLRTDIWSDSSLSSTPFNQPPASVIGKKRSHPRTSKGRAHRVEEGLRDYEPSDLQRPSSSSHEKRSMTPYSQSHALERLESVSTSDAADSVEVAHSTSSSERNECNDREQTPRKEKRRKVTKSRPMRTVKPSRPIRNKTSNINSPPRSRTHTTVNLRQMKRSKGRHLLEVPASPAKRRSERLKAEGSMELEKKGMDQNNGVSIDERLSTESSARETAIRMRKK